MRKFALVVVLGFLLVGSSALAWQDPCSATQNTYEYADGYVLGDWEPAEAMFSPAPQCVGTVILRAPDGMWYEFDYIGNRSVLTIAGIPCRVSDYREDDDGNSVGGDLVCRIVTVPEESTTLVFGLRE